MEIMSFKLSNKVNYNNWSALQFEGEIILITTKHHEAENDFYDSYKRKTVY